jgi:hypothetical protein
MPPLTAPPQLFDASKIDAILKFTGVGLTVNAAVGVWAGGRITPGGTRRISTDREFEACALSPVTVARIVTMAPAPTIEFGGNEGAVKVTTALPLASVVGFLFDSVPKS